MATLFLYLKIVVRCREVICMNGYMKVSDASVKWGISNRRIVTLCNEGRIDGAIKFGNTWAIPDDTEKPKDERIKSGKYVKNL